MLGDGALRPVPGWRPPNVFAAAETPSPNGLGIPINKGRARGNGPATVPPGGCIDCQRARAVPRGPRRSAVSTPYATAESSDPSRAQALRPLPSASRGSLWTDKLDLDSMIILDRVVKVRRHGSSGLASGSFPSGNLMFPRKFELDVRGMAHSPALAKRSPGGMGRWVHCAWYG